jgi:hypothetical protein
MLIVQAPDQPFCQSVGKAEAELEPAASASRTRESRFRADSGTASRLPACAASTTPGEHAVPDGLEQLRWLHYCRGRGSWPFRGLIFGLPDKCTWAFPRLSASFSR